MRSSRTITLTLLSAGMLTACCCALPGSRSRPRDMTWYDVHGKPIPEQWRTDASGKRIPAVTPYDAYGRPWIEDHEGWHPQDPPGTTYASHHRGGFFPIFFRSGSSSSVSRGGFGSSFFRSVGS